MTVTYSLAGYEFVIRCLTVLLFQLVPVDDDDAFAMHETSYL